MLRETPRYKNRIPARVGMGDGKRKIWEAPWVREENGRQSGGYRLVATAAGVALTIAISTSSSSSSSSSASSTSSSTSSTSSSTKLLRLVRRRSHGLGFFDTSCRSTCVASCCLLALLRGYWCRHWHYRSAIRWAVGRQQSHPAGRRASRLRPLPP